MSLPPNGNVWAGQPRDAARDALGSRARRPTRYNCAPGQDLPEITAPDRRSDWSGARCHGGPTTTRGRRSTPAPRPSRRSPRSRRPRPAVAGPDRRVLRVAKERRHRVCGRPFVRDGGDPGVVDAPHGAGGAGRLRHRRRGAPRAVRGGHLRAQRAGRRPARPDGGRPQPHGGAPVARGAPGGGTRPARPLPGRRAPLVPRGPSTTSRTTRPT